MQANLGGYATAVGRYVDNLNCLAIMQSKKKNESLVKTLGLLSFSDQALCAISIDLDRLSLARPPSLGEWPTVIWDLLVLLRHKGEASLVKSPFLPHTRVSCAYEKDT